MAIVECEGLTKRYGGRVAVDGFSVQIEAGEVFGLLGPNGAGKTTLFRLLLGLTHSDLGSAQIMGSPVPMSPRIQQQVGAMIEDPAFYNWMNAPQALRVHARGVGLWLRRGRIEEILENVGLGDVGKKSVKKFSQGMRQRLGLARAILHGPKIVILDEPANGLDPAGIVWLRELVRELAGSGATVIVSSHQLGEIEKVCDRVAIVNQGRLVEIGRVADVGNDAGMVRVVVRSEDIVVTGPILAGFGAEDRGDGLFMVRNTASREVLSSLVARGILPEFIGKEHTSLEARFLEITAGTN